MYCCELECFEAPKDQVDGRACKRCNSFGFCRCKCKTLSAKALTGSFDKLAQASKPINIRNNKDAPSVCKVS